MRLAPAALCIAAGLWLILVQHSGAGDLPPAPTELLARPTLRPGEVET